MSHELITADLGPKVTAWTGRVAGKLVCIATPRVEYDASARREVRNLIRRQGGDCSTCKGCLIGRDA